MPRVLAVLVLLASAITAPAEDKPFVLRWYGQSYFQLETPSGKKIVFDPHAIPEFGRHVVAADVILCSHRHDDHNQLEVVENHRASRVFQGLKEPKAGKPADWNPVDEKVGQIRVRTVPTYHDPENGIRRGKNAVWVIETEGLTVCHLGDLGHELTDTQVKAIGPVDVLLVPVGGVYTLNGEHAKKVVEQIVPNRFVLPMHYGVPGYTDLLPPDEFLDGRPNVKRMTGTNELTIPAEARAGEEAAVVLLGWQKTGAADKP
jgi:L-ascorbate metabolism protein UlaG (beta-lactamase superfamily)